MNLLPRKVGHAIIRWSQDVQIKFPVTTLDKLSEVRISLGDGKGTVLRARFEDESGVLMMRGGTLAGEAWLPVLTNENTWYRRVREAGGLVEVLEVPPELPGDEAPEPKEHKRRGPKSKKTPPATTPTSSAA